MADAIHISLAYFPFFTHKLEANFSWRKTCVFIMSEGYAEIFHCLPGGAVPKPGSLGSEWGNGMGHLDGVVFFGTSGWMFIPQH